MKSFILLFLINFWFSSFFFPYEKDSIFPFYKSHRVILNSFQVFVFPLFYFSYVMVYIYFYGHLASSCNILEGWSEIFFIFYFPSFRFFGKSYLSLVHSFLLVCKIFGIWDQL